MLTEMMKRCFIPMLLLALWWPSPVGHYILLGFAVCIGAIWAVQASGAGKYFREMSDTTLLNSAPAIPVRDHFAPIKVVFLLGIHIRSPRAVGLAWELLQTPPADKLPFSPR